MPITGVISEVVTPKDKTKSNLLGSLKVRILSKSEVSFQSFPVSLRGFYTPTGLPASKHGSKMNRNKKLAS